MSTGMPPWREAPLGLKSLVVMTGGFVSLVSGLVVNTQTLPLFDEDANIIFNFLGDVAVGAGAVGFTAGAVGMGVAFGRGELD